MTIKLKNISYTASGFKILENVSLNIKRGEILSLIGPNGAGKSTLLNVATGDLEPSSGTVIYNDQDLKQLNIVERSFYRAVMSQSQQIVFDFSVQEIIEMGWVDRGLPNYSKNFDKAVKEVTTLCDLENLLNRNLINFQVGNKEEFILPEHFFSFGDHPKLKIHFSCF